VSLHVLVVHDTEAIREAIVRLLDEAGYRPSAVADGDAAVAAVAAPEPPDALILDVAVAGTPSFAVIERARALRLPMPIVLIASVYNRAGYKRRPTSLYGADDYVEQHHIPDLLLLKLARLLGRPLPDGEQVEDAVAREEEPIRRAGEARLGIRYQGREEGEARARRLARLIVADIALYNHDLVQLQDDAEREARLRVDLEEGRLLFDLRVPREIRDGRDFIGEALAEWLSEWRHQGPEAGWRPHRAHEGEP
jgi:CheY-like chemotaxis protein